MGLEDKFAPASVTMEDKFAPTSVTIADLMLAAERNTTTSAMSAEVVQGSLANSRVRRWRNADQAHPWWTEDQVPAPCTLCKQIPRCPRFLVAIPHPSTPPNPEEEEDLSLAVPGIFWEIHSSMLECDELQLKGPNDAIIKVKVKKTYNEEEGKLYVRLEDDWEVFVVSNDLQDGDILEFFLVASSCFTVYHAA